MKMSQTVNKFESTKDKKEDKNFVSIEKYHKMKVILSSFIFTLILFLVLPIMQTINKPFTKDLVVRTVDTVNVPPPPPPPEPEMEQEQEPQEQPPELTETSQPLDLSQLEIALNPGFSDGWMQGDFVVSLNNVVSKSEDLDALFSMAELDQKPRILYQPQPLLNDKIRKRMPGTVYIIFVVNKDGRVANPMVQQATDSVFERPAINAVKQWKFEPGKRNGKAVRFRMRVPISFSKG